MHGSVILFTIKVVSSPRRSGSTMAFIGATTTQQWSRQLQNTYPPPPHCITRVHVFCYNAQHLTCSQFSGMKIWIIHVESILWVKDIYNFGIVLLIFPSIIVGVTMNSYVCLAIYIQYLRYLDFLFRYNLLTRNEDAPGIRLWSYYWG